MVYTAAGVIFAASIAAYNRRFFRVDKNAMNFFAFAIGSAPASYAYSNFFFNDAESEAGVLNNQRELQM